MPHASRILAAIALAAIACESAARAADYPPVAPVAVRYFEQKVRPLLIERCYSCHSQTKEVKGGLALDSRGGWAKGGDSGPAIVPGKPDESPLIVAVRYKNADLQMPPTDRLPD